MKNGHNTFPLREACPGRGLLCDLSLGRLPIDLIEVVGKHVEGCASCQCILESFDDLEDSFVFNLKHGPNPRPPTVTPQLERQLRAAEAISQVVWGATPAQEKADDPLPQTLGQYQLLERHRPGRHGSGLQSQAPQAQAAGCNQAAGRQLRGRR